MVTTHMIRSKVPSLGTIRLINKHFRAKTIICYIYKVHLCIILLFSYMYFLQSYVGLKGRSSNSRHNSRMDMEDDVGRHHNGMEDDADMDQSSGAEYDMSD